MQKKIIIFFFLIKTSIALSQSINIDSGLNNISLTKCLIQFEKEHDLLFSYANNNSDAILISLKGQKSFSISELQNWIKINTSFFLKKNTPKSYSLIPKKEYLTYKSLIYDKEYGLPLQAISIINLSQKSSTYTNKLGAFSIEITDLQDSLKISNPLYNEIILKSSEQKDTIWLTPIIELLDEVVIKEYIQKGIKKNANGSIELINDEQRTLPGIIEQDVLQNLQTLPGVTSPTESASLIYIRGGSPDQNNTLWNGIQIYNTGHFFGEISAFNPFINKKTTFYRSGTQVKYGNRVGGVISMETETATPDKNKFGIGSDLLNLSGDLQLKTSKKSGIIAGVRRSNTDIFNTFVEKNINQKNFENTRFSLKGRSNDKDNRTTYTDASISYNLNFNTNHFLQVNTIFITNGFKNSIIQNSNNQATEPLINDLFITTTTIETKEKYDDLKTTNYGTNIVSKNKITKKSDLESKLYFSKYNLTFNQKSRDSVNILSSIQFPDENGNIVNSTGNSLSVEEDQSTTKNNVEDLNFETFYNLNFNKKNKLSIGYQLSNVKANYNYDIFSKDTLSFEEEADVEIDKLSFSGETNQHTLSNEYTHTSSKVNFNIGYRLSKASSFSSFFFEPRIYASYKINRNHRLTSSFEIKNQFLNQITDVVDEEFNNLVWYLSKSKVADQDGETNEEFPVLNSMQFTIGYLFKYKNFHADLELYNNNLTGVSSLNLGFEQIDNNNDQIFLGSEKRRGLDLLLNQKINNYQLWLSYSYSNIKNKFDTLSSKSFSGNFEQPHRIKISQTYLWKGFDFGLSWIYSSGTPYSEPNGISQDESTIIFNPNEINSLRLPDFSRFDFSAVKSFILNKKKSKLIAGVSLKNILNKKNIIRRTFNLQRNNITDVLQIIQRDQFSLRFTPNILIRYTF